jgi:hypothetical protein
MSSTTATHPNEQRHSIHEAELAQCKKVIADMRHALQAAQTGLESAVKRAIKSDVGLPVNATAEYQALVTVITINKSYASLI